MPFKRFLRIGVLLVILVCAFTAADGYFDIFIEKMGMGRISNANDIYLDQSFSNAIDGFLILSGIKGGLAVIEGSGIGIGFNIEVGDFVQPIYDYVDIAWRTSLAGGIIILLTRLVLQTTAMIDHWCLCLMFLTIFSILIQQWYFTNYYKSFRIVKEVTLFITILAVTLYLILPVTITGASFISKKITGPLISESQKGFSGMKDDFSPAKLDQQFFSDYHSKNTSWLSKIDRNTNPEKIKQNMEKMEAYFAEKTRNISILAVKLIAGYLFDCIIFPAAFFLVIFGFTRAMIRYAFVLKRNFVVNEDIEVLIKKIDDRFRDSKRSG